jgi:oligopeptidase B
MESTTTSEWRYADAGAAELRFEVFLPREHGHEHQIEHLGGEFLIRTNWQARNFRLMRVADEGSHGRERWRELVAHREETLIEDFEAFSSFVALSVRSDGLSKISIKPWSPTRCRSGRTPSPMHGGYATPTLP